jgi:hypothetical protein
MGVERLVLLLIIMASPLQHLQFHDPDLTEPLLSTSSSMYAVKGDAPLNTRL